MAQQVLTDLDFANVSKITNLPNGTNPQDAATVAQLNSAVEAISWKTSARVATSSNVNIAAPGATVDGITMVSGDRVLVRAQTAASANGIYVWNGAATPMTRALDANTARELEQATLSIEEGTSASSTYRQTSINFTLDTGDVLWTTFGASVGAASETNAGTAEIATQAETDAGTDDARIITPAKLASWSGRVRKFDQDIGDGSATTFTVTHNLNTRNVRVEVFRNSGNYDTVITEVRRTSVNAVQIVVASAPASNAFHVTILG